MISEVMVEQGGRIHRFDLHGTKLAVFSLDQPFIPEQIERVIKTRCANEQLFELCIVRNDDIADPREFLLNAARLLVSNKLQDVQDCLHQASIANNTELQEALAELERFESQSDRFNIARAPIVKQLCAQLEEQLADIARRYKLTKSQSIKLALLSAYHEDCRRWLSLQIQLLNIGACSEINDEAVRVSEQLHRTHQAANDEERRLKQAFEASEEALSSLSPIDSALVRQSEYLDKIAALANVHRKLTIEIQSVSGEIASRLDGLTKLSSRFESEWFPLQAFDQIGMFVRLLHNISQLCEEKGILEARLSTEQGKVDRIADEDAEKQRLLTRLNEQRVQLEQSVLTKPTVSEVRELETTLKKFESHAANRSRWCIERDVQMQEMRRKLSTVLSVNGGRFPSGFVDGAVPVGGTKYDTGRLASLEQTLDAYAKQSDQLRMAVADSHSAIAQHEIAISELEKRLGQLSVPANLCSEENVALAKIRVTEFRQHLDALSEMQRELRSIQDEIESSRSKANLNFIDMSLLSADRIAEIGAELKRYRHQKEKIDNELVLLRFASKSLRSRLDRAAGTAAQTDVEQEFVRNEELIARKEDSLQDAFERIGNVLRQIGLEGSSCTSLDETLLRDIYALDCRKTSLQTKVGTIIESSKQLLREAISLLNVQSGEIDPAHLSISLDKVVESRQAAIAHNNLIKELKVQLAHAVERLDVQRSQGNDALAAYRSVEQDRIALAHELEQWLAELGVQRQSAGRVFDLANESIELAETAHVLSERISAEEEACRQLRNVLDAKLGTAGKSDGSLTQSLMQYKEESSLREQNETTISELAQTASSLVNEVEQLRRILTEQDKSVLNLKNELAIVSAKMDMEIAQLPEAARTRLAQLDIVRCIETLQELQAQQRDLDRLHDAQRDLESQWNLQFKAVRSVLTEASDMSFSDVGAFLSHRIEEIEDVLRQSEQIELAEIHRAQCQTALAAAVDKRMHSADNLYDYLQKFGVTSHMELIDAKVRYTQYCLLREEVAKLSASLVNSLEVESVDELRELIERTDFDGISDQQEILSTELQELSETEQQVREQLIGLKSEFENLSDVVRMQEYFAQLNAIRTKCRRLATDEMSFAFCAQIADRERSNLERVARCRLIAQSSQLLSIVTDERYQIAHANDTAELSLEMFSGEIVEMVPSLVCLVNACIKLAFGLMSGQALTFLIRDLSLLGPAAVSLVRALTLRDHQIFAGTSPSVANEMESVAKAIAFP